MRIESVTKFRCDGCGKEETNISGWRMMQVLSFSKDPVYRRDDGPDFCPDCLKVMLEALKKGAGYR
jgi:hypothetical protein